MADDWAYLAQNDTCYHALFVPKLVNSSENNLAKLAYIMPIQSCMINQTAFVT